MHPAILIHGPTASVKTALAIAVARRLGGEVINADSMQVYRDLQVISARPDAEEMDGVEHHLFGHVDAATRYSTGDWLEEARREIKRVELKGKRAILVVTSGGVPVNSAVDFATPHLTQVLHFIGIQDVQVIAADQQLTTADALARAEAQIQALVA